MNLKQLGILLVLVAVLGAAGMIVFKKQNAARSAGNTAIGQKVMGDLPVNDISHVSIRHGTNELNLVKKDDLWRVSERQDYPANFGQISEFLLKVRDLKAVQTEQVGPSQLPRLQLAPGQGTNAPTVVEFRGAGDKAIGTLLLGKMHMNSGRSASPMMGESEGGWPDGRYVMVGANSGSVAVISNPFENIEPKPQEWLNKDLVRVEKSKSIEVDFPVATNSWKLTRETETGEWKLADARAGEQVDSSKISSVTSPFSSPSFSDVSPGDKIEGSGTNRPTVVKIETFDGFSYTVKIGAKTNDNYLVHFAVTAQLPKERVAGKDEKPEDKVKLDKEFKDRQQKLEEKLKQEQFCGNWTYLLASWSVDPVIKERSQLLVEKKDEPKAGEDGTNSVKSAEEPKVEDPALPAIHTEP
ncbi:MAG TPA: DUF4340 domain-containing protein [Candidatus Paceibacterota bacterium]|nr:DUF4340 domain-containing protein [Candidatus Paceibacterota bacterium]